MKVIGAGYGRTGTTSLMKALEDLGFGPCYHMQEVIKHPAHVTFWRTADQRSDEEWRNLFARYSAGIDWPVCEFYPRLLSLYPDAKVILSVRDEDRWYESTLETIYKVSNLIPHWQRYLLWPIARFYNMVNALIWDGTFQGRFEDKDFALGILRNHIEEVKSSVPPDKLLVFKVQDGWEPLCEFLGVDVPPEPFPHLNDRRMMQLLLWFVRGLTVIVPLVLLTLIILISLWLLNSGS